MLELTLPEAMFYGDEHEHDIDREVAKTTLAHVADEIVAYFDDDCPHEPCRYRIDCHSCVLELVAALKEAQKV
jgi:hypothetical protein